MGCVLRLAGKLAVSVLLVGLGFLALIAIVLALSELDNAGVQWEKTCASAEAHVASSTLAALCGSN